MVSFQFGDSGLRVLLEPASSLKVSYVLIVRFLRIILCKAREESSRDEKTGKRDRGLADSRVEGFDLSAMELWLGRDFKKGVGWRRAPRIEKAGSG